MALSEEAFPPKFIDGEEVPHPSTIASQPAPTMRRAQLSEEAFPDRPDAFYMTPIQTTQPHHRVPREVSVEELLAHAITAQERSAVNRDLLARRFIAAGLSEQAIGISSRTHQIDATHQARINALQDQVERQATQNLH